MNLNAATLIIEVLSFIILVGLLIKFLYRPVLNILDKRVEEINQANKMIRENLTLAERGRTEAQKILAESKNQALKIKEKVTLDAEQTRQKIIAQAKDETARILHTCEREIINETQKAKEKIKTEAIDLSFKLAEKILHREFASEDQKRLITELTKGIK